MKYFFALLITGIICSACTKEIPLKEIYPFEGEKIVVNAYLIPSESISVHVTKTVSPYELGEFDVSLHDAEVELYEDGVLISEMIPDEDNFYITQENVYPAVGKQYHFKVSHPTLDDVQTIPECVPAAAVINSVELIEIDELLRIQFNFLDNVEDDAYSLTVLSIDSLNSERARLTDFSIFENNPILCGVRSFYFDDSCFDEPSVTLNIDLERTREHLEYENRSILVSFYTRTESNYQYEISRNQLEDFYGFGDPAALFSNVTGGYGAVTAYNLQEYIIEL